jgi:hypothetical protein
LAQTLCLCQHSGFQARKRKIQIATVQQGPGLGKGLGIPLLGQASQAWATWVRQPQ